MPNDMQDFHHYKGNKLSPAEKVERKVIELLISSTIADTERESSVVWEIKHASGCVQIGRILAQKRGLNIDIAAAACVLHDISVAVEGKYKEHAKHGAVIAEKILREVGAFSEEQIKTITDGVLHHSEKEIISSNPYVELVKDADVFDCSLYRNSEGFYKLHKPEDIFEAYQNRVKKVRQELNLPEEPIFR